MQRKIFIRNAALCAVAVSATGSVRFNGMNFEGDCETTTDILGPFYRPDARSVKITYNGLDWNNKMTTWEAVKEK